MSNELYILSDSGVKVYKRPEYHPQLKGTDLRHPDFLRKLGERFSRGKVKGLPRICSENSEDALTWHHFSPFLDLSKETGSWLKVFLSKALEGRAGQQTLDSAGEPQLLFWQGRRTPENVYGPPPSRVHREGATEVDLTIQLGHQALIFVEAKRQSDIAVSTTYDARRDQIIRNIDVGSWHSRQQGLREFYFILVSDDRSPDKKYSQMMNLYRSIPGALKAALPYRDDMTEEDFATMANQIGWIT